MVSPDWANEVMALPTSSRATAVAAEASFMAVSPIPGMIAIDGKIRRVGITDRTITRGNISRTILSGTSGTITTFALIVRVCPA